MVALDIAFPIGGEMQIVCAFTLCKASSGILSYIERVSLTCHWGVGCLIIQGLRGRVVAIHLGDITLFRGK